MVTKNVLICMVFLVLLMAGCTQERQMGHGGNFTIALHCGNAIPLPLRLDGNVYMDSGEFAASNCSVHVANRVITVKCTRAELTVPPLVRETEHYLQLGSNRSES